MAQAFVSWGFFNFKDLMLPPLGDVLEGIRCGQLSAAEVECVADIERVDVQRHFGRHPRPEGNVHIDIFVEAELQIKFVLLVGVPCAGQASEDGIQNPVLEVADHAAGVAVSTQARTPFMVIMPWPKPYGQLLEVPEELKIGEDIDGPLHLNRRVPRMQVTRHSPDVATQLGRQSKLHEAKWRVSGSDVQGDFLE